MKAQIRLGRVLGVRVGLHYSWLILAVLMIFSLAGLFHMMSPGWRLGLVWWLAVLTSALFFLSLIVHELSHALVAKSRGLVVNSITLFALGGVAQIAREAADPWAEFWMGIAGPITSAAIGFGCHGLARLLGSPVDVLSVSPAQSVFGWLGTINIAIAIFNMIPAFPLDGGRVLRAAIWGATKDQDRATKIAARSGQLIAILFILFGLLRFFGGAGLSGIWLAFIGWFLLEAATASYVQVEASEMLRGARVADIMSRDFPVVNGSEHLNTFVDDYLLRTGRHCFVVREDGHLTGLITPHEVKGFAPARWREVTVDEAKRPLQSLRTVRPDAPVSEALDIMGREDINQLPVLSEDRFEGVISRGQILQMLQTLSEIQA